MANQVATSKGRPDLTTDNRLRQGKSTYAVEFAIFLSAIHWSRFGWQSMDAIMKPR
ncbi:hypothetical protein CCP4SC76_1890010 [Gammaproteobacteria bacterium]